MANQKPTIVFGTAGVVAMSTEVLNGMLSTLEKHNVKNIDTAFIYVWLPQI
jgi:aflatoxin B1 aldehyde reductase